jgi:hypothetical protein
LYHKWVVKNGFTFVLQFFSLIFDGLGDVLRHLLALCGSSSCSNTV